MGLIKLLFNFILRLFDGVGKNNLKRVCMKFKRKFKLVNLSMAAGELIVAVLENDGAALKTEDGVFVAANEKNTLFRSAIPQNERASDDEILEELCDRGLLRKYNEKIYYPTNKAKKNAEKLERLDELRVFIYAPELVKSLFPIMREEGATLRVLNWNDCNATIEAGNERGFQTNLVNRRDAEISIVYLYRHKLINNLRFVDSNDGNFFRLTIKEGFDVQQTSAFFGGASRVKVAAAFSEKGRRVATIDPSSLDKYAKQWGYK